MNRHLVIDVTEPGYGIGYVSTDDPTYPIFSIFIDRRAPDRWEAWTDDFGTGKGASLAVAVKRWARQAGIEHGTATIDYEYAGRIVNIAW